jgi:protein involved in temperature-dependent protein secretion
MQGQLCKGSYARASMQGHLCKGSYARAAMQGQLYKGSYARAAMQGQLFKGSYARAAMLGQDRYDRVALLWLILKLNDYNRRDRQKRWAELFCTMQPFIIQEFKKGCKDD